MDYTTVTGLNWIDLPKVWTVLSQGSERQTVYEELNHFHLIKKKQTGMIVIVMSGLLYTLEREWKGSKKKLERISFILVKCSIYVVLH